MYLIYTAQEEKLRKAWTNVLSHSFDKYMKQSGLFYIIIWQLLIPLNEIIIGIAKEGENYTQEKIDECDNYLRGCEEVSSRFHDGNYDKDNDRLIQLSIQLRFIKAYILKIFLALRNPFWYDNCCVPNVIKAISLCKSLGDFIHIYVGNEKFQKYLRTNRPTLNVKKNGTIIKSSKTNGNNHQQFRAILTSYKKFNHFQSFLIKKAEEKNMSTMRDMEKHHQSLLIKEIFNKHPEINEMKQWYMENNNDDTIRGMMDRINHSMGSKILS